MSDESKDIFKKLIDRFDKMKAKHDVPCNLAEKLIPMSEFDRQLGAEPPTIVLLTTVKPSCYPKSIITEKKPEPPRYKCTWKIRPPSGGLALVVGAKSGGLIANVLTGEIGKAEDLFTEEQIRFAEELNSAIKYILKKY